MFSPLWQAKCEGNKVYILAYVLAIFNFELFHLFIYLLVGNTIPFVSCVIESDNIILAFIGIIARLC